MGTRRKRTRRTGRSHQAAANIVPPQAFEEVMKQHGLSVGEAATALARTPARVRELTKRYGGSPRAFERFVLALNDRIAPD
jgi:hypothetical protein